MGFSHLEVSAEDLEKVQWDWNDNLVIKLGQNVTLCLDKLLFRGVGDMFEPTL